MSVPKINKLIIKNFGCIGDNEVSVDINKIVVIVGANNAGKSTILRAFEVVTDSLRLDLDDFHGKVVIADKTPIIEVHSIVVEENKPGDEWCEKISDTSWLVKEKWCWVSPNVEPKRIGFNVLTNKWSEDKDKEKKPWGLDNVAKSKRPKPHRVNTFDAPAVQAKAIISLLKSYLEEKIKSLKSDETAEKTRYSILVESLNELRKDSKLSQTDSIEQIQKEANEILEKIFPSYGLRISNPELNDEIKIDFLGEDFGLEMGVNGENFFPLEKQGSGTQRTALWTILKLLADRGLKAKAATKGQLFEPLGQNKSHILLIDEPEVSLHPAAVSAARDVLYSLPNNENWQVMLTTHSPHFIDLSKDHTTIIRAEKDAHNNVVATTLYNPEKVKLSDDDKENLKLLNLFDSHISDAFFGGKIMVVEGDTEYSAFHHIINNELAAGNKKYSDIHIIRARGKVTVSSMMKVLNHFKANYYVLHDTDKQKTISKTKDKKRSTETETVYKIIEIANPAWTNNSKISNEFSNNVKVFASIINFEEAYFSEVVNSDKPENCINNLKTNPDLYSTVKQLLDSILEIENVPLPPGAIQWKTIEELDSAVNSWVANISEIHGEGEEETEEEGCTM